MRVRPFTDDDLPEAGRLLAARHAEHRRREPLLPSAYEDPAAAQAEVAALWQAEGASGAVAVDGDEVVGYLLGAPRRSAVWGDNTWVEAAGSAVREPALLRPLYAAAAQPWVDSGRTAHYAVVPAGDPAAADAWFRLGFGLQQVHAVREPADLPLADGVRRAQPGDVPALAELDVELPLHQSRSPVFAGGTVPTVEEMVADWEDTLDDERYTAFVVEQDGAVVGSSVACPVELTSSHAGVARPDGAVYFAVAVVHPDARGRGAGRALGDAVIAHAHATGAPALVTDWRATNLQSSRAWSALGYRESFWRLHRVVGF